MLFCYAITLVLSCILAPIDQLLWVTALSHSLCWRLASLFSNCFGRSAFNSTTSINLPSTWFSPPNGFAHTSTHVNRHVAVTPTRVCTTECFQNLPSKPIAAKVKYSISTTLVWKSFSNERVQSRPTAYWVSTCHGLAAMIARFGGQVYITVQVLKLKFHKKACAWQDSDCMCFDSLRLTAKTAALHIWPKLRKKAWALSHWVAASFKDPITGLHAHSVWARLWWLCTNHSSANTFSWCNDEQNLLDQQQACTENQLEFYRQSCDDCRLPMIRLWASWTLSGQIPFTTASC